MISNFERVALLVDLLRCSHSQSLGTRLRRSHVEWMGVYKLFLRGDLLAGLSEACRLGIYEVLSCRDYFLCLSRGKQKGL